VALAKPLDDHTAAAAVLLADHGAGEHVYLWERSTSCSWIMFQGKHMHVSQRNPAAIVPSTAATPELHAHGHASASSSTALLLLLPLLGLPL
jgi:hypothetical protein